MSNRDWEDLIQRLISQGILKSPPVIQALRRVPRELFTPKNMRSYAAVDSPLPTGYGQTISAPHS